SKLKELLKSSISLLSALLNLPPQSFISIPPIYLQMYNYLNSLCITIVIIFLQVAVETRVILPAIL
ncbi:MAG: hypothetical protein AAGU01_06110, partial [Clostridiaceae bacterium]